MNCAMLPVHPDLHTYQVEWASARRGRAAVGDHQVLLTPWASKKSTAYRPESNGRKIRFLNLLQWEVITPSVPVTSHPVRPSSIPLHGRAAIPYLLRCCSFCSPSWPGYKPPPSPELRPFNASQFERRDQCPVILHALSTHSFICADQPSSSQNDVSGRREAFRSAAHFGFRRGPR